MNNSAPHKRSRVAEPEPAGTPQAVEAPAAAAAATTAAAAAAVPASAAFDPLALCQRLTTRQLTQVAVYSRQMVAGRARISARASLWQPYLENALLDGGEDDDDDVEFWVDLVWTAKDGSRQRRCIYVVCDSDRFRSLSVDGRETANRIAFGMGLKDFVFSNGDVPTWKQLDELILLLVGGKHVEFNHEFVEDDERWWVTSVPVDAYEVPTTATLADTTLPPFVACKGCCSGGGV